ncbi:MAG: inorganic phosphate transporter [Planctomycetota bacterium]
MDTLLVVVVGAIAVALVFDVINGFHDAANSIATVVSTRVLSPRVAVLWAAFFNFVAMFVFAPKVANTISKIVRIDPDEIAFIYVVLAGLIGAIAWDLVTWWWGIPSSSSHALVGGISGAGITYAGWSVLHWDKLITTLEFILVAPVLGMILGIIVMIGVFWLVRRWRPRVIDRRFRRAQLFSAAAYSLGHGGNDAQKTMGVIVALLVASRHMPAGTDHVPLWIILSCHAAMALGTAFGGWRIVKTMGMRITRLQPVGGFSAETAGAVTLFLSTFAGIPVSTTHTITGAIVGVGAPRRLSAVRWGVAGRIVWAWIFTIPASAAIGAIAFEVMALLNPTF